MAWTPGPRYLLRRYCVLQLLKKLPRGRLLEVGHGTGDLLLRAAELGYDVVGTDSSEAAREEAARRLDQHDAQLVESLADVEGRFDYLVSFEVLEHIEHDREALAEWIEFLEPDGRLLLSVPAHKKRWGASDVSAGHFRRYERDELSALITEQGLEIELLWCYGFPLANMVEPMRDAAHARVMRKSGEQTMAERTAKSGLGLGPLARGAGALLNSPLILPFCWMQMLFLNGEAGNGYLLQARLPRAASAQGQHQREGRDDTEAHEAV